MEIVKGFIEGIINIYSNNPKLLLETIILIILCVLLKIYYPKFRGFMGEFWVKLELSKLPKEQYIVLNDIMIKDERGTHQIDHLVISKYGIFVIEMKNYYGLIKGNEYQDKWVQYLGKNKYYFKNPIHQNYGHVKVLEKILNLNINKFIPVVCFSNQAKLNITNKSIVVQLDKLLKIIKQFNEVQLEIDINPIANKIESLNIIEKDKRKKHIKNIKQKINEENVKENHMICPKCGNNLVIKNGKYGNFIGCSNYPNCKYTK